MVKKPAKAEPSLKKEFLLFISIPASIILIVAAIIVLPQLLAKPHYDFIYSYCPEYACSNDVVIGSNGIVTTLKRDVQVYPNAGSTQIYYWSARTNASQPISIQQANTYKLDPTNVSPDGYILKQGNTSGGVFLFWGASGDYNWYLKNGLKKKQVHLADQGIYSPTQVRVLGWVK